MDADLAILVSAGTRSCPLPTLVNGFRTEMCLERVSYPGEVQTRRAYLLARRQS